MSPVLDLYIKGIGFVYLIAFYSLLREAKGLYGEHGLSPIKKIWSLDANDHLILGLCYAGILFSLFVIFGFLTPFALGALWLLYLAFLREGSPFIDFQWDTLLTEAGFYTFLLALGLPMVLLLDVLIFRLMFRSGYVKWKATTEHWRTFCAMDYHYESQPLPNPLSFFAHHLPGFFSRFSCYGVYVFELFVPLLIFFGEWGRLLACVLIIFFQLLIAATGNFAFFNLLSIVLCLPLLAPFEPLSLWWIPELFLIALLFAPLKYKYYFSGWGFPFDYGLFADMTRGREEIILEGSLDGQNWVPYEFYYKPGPVDKMPRQIAPLQPRLEWQLWFITKFNWRRIPWYINLVHGLLEGRPEITKFFKKLPFETPPVSIRAALYTYKFASWKEWREKGIWWTRERLGLWAPPLSK